MNIIHIYHYAHIGLTIHIKYICNIILYILNRIIDIFAIKTMQTLLYIFYNLKILNI